MQTDATSPNNSQHCWVLLANNVAFACMGLKVWPVSNYTQQVPTSPNIVVVPCKRTQQVTTLLDPTMLGLFAWALKVMLPLTNISRERSSFCYFLCRIQNKNSPPFPRLKYVLSMFLFLPFGSSKKVLQKEKWKKSGGVVRLVII